jgi:hypothetical protein
MVCASVADLVLMVAPSATVKLEDASQNASRNSAKLSNPASFAKRDTVPVPTWQAAAIDFTDNSSPSPACSNRKRAMPAFVEFEGSEVRKETRETGSLS